MPQTQSGSRFALLSDEDSSGWDGDHRDHGHHHEHHGHHLPPGPAPQIDLTALDGANGFVVDGVSPGDGLGAAVGGAGDLNGDGVADLVLGAPTATRHGIADIGEAYILFGHGGHFAPTVELASLDGDGLVVTDSSGQSFSQLGHAVAGLGDVNGDGIDDVGIGAPGEIRRFTTPDQTFGKAGVIDGAHMLDGAGHTVDLAALNGSDGFSLALDPASQGQGLGIALAGGDVNGDGISDLLVSGETSSFSGLNPFVSVLFGGAGIGDAGTVDPATIDPAHGFRITASQILTSTFVSLTPAVGDFTGDGVSDIAVGQFTSNGPSVTFGAEVIPGGHDIGSGGNIQFGAPTPGSFTFTVDAAANHATTGILADAGDVNGDGIDDLLVGIGPESFVIFGGTGIKPNTTLDASQLDGHNGFVLHGAGTAVSSAGDFNGDGFADLLLAGATNDYLVFGGKHVGASGSVDLTTLHHGAGVVLTGGATAVAAAGDVNGDGFDDVVLGNAAAGAAGQAYVVFGTDRFDATGHEPHPDETAQVPVQHGDFSGFGLGHV